MSATATDTSAQTDDANRALLGLVDGDLREAMRVLQMVRSTLDILQDRIGKEAQS